MRHTMPAALTVLMAMWTSLASASSLEPSCQPAAGGGTAVSAAPTLLATLSDRWHEAWLGSPAVADLDGDGTKEILAPRHQQLLGWHLDNTVVFRTATSGSRIWSSPVVADLVPQQPGLEVAVAGGDSLYAWTASGTPLPGFPVSWRSELRALAAADIDGDGALELVMVTTSKLSASGQNDIVMAYEADGSPVAGFPPNTTGAAGCDDRCYVTGGFDQTIALGDVDGDLKAELFVAQDNAYLSLHQGTGFMFDSNPAFQWPTKFAGIRFLHDWALAVQGWAPDEETANQAHFTNSAPAVADLDGDGIGELIILGSVQNAAQTDRERGVALWVLTSDGSRFSGWQEPYHVPAYLSGLWDLGGNIVAATNQVTVAEIDAAHAGPELIFAGFDGNIHAVSRNRVGLWTYPYTTSTDVLTGGVAVADLSGDGLPEVIFTSYSTATDASHLFVLSADGTQQHKLALPDRGAMPVPTVADVDGNGTLEIIISLKDGIDWTRQVLVYTVPGSAATCLPWPTGRGNDLRSGAVGTAALFVDGFESGGLTAWSANSR